MALNIRFTTAISALVRLANEPEKLHTSEDIAAWLNTNPVVLRRIFSQLRHAELVLSHKGPNGGTRLARPAKQITLRDIHRAVDLNGILPAPKLANEPALQSILKNTFVAATRAAEKELNETTLAQLVKKTAKKSK